METKHTKGPWVIFNQKEILNGKETMGIDGDGKSVIIFEDTNTNREISPEEELANAKLIAAAPEMLDALIRIEKSITNKHMVNQFGHSLSYVREAIKRATE